MARILIIIVLTIFALFGCQSSPQGPSRADLFENYVKQQDAAYRAGQITLTERVKRVTDYNYQLYGRNKYNTEVNSYALALAPKVDSKIMTQAEYEYLMTVKRNEIRSRRDAEEARDRSLQLQEQAVRESNRPVQCQTFFGTTRCERSD